MQSMAVSGRLAVSVAFAAIFLCFAAVLPNHAAAQTASSIQTQELLPPGQNTCQAISLADVEPHVYGGVLESFDVTISDTSDGYVGILGTIGGSPVPLNYITRWAGEPSGLRIHVDAPDVPVNGTLPVTLTLLSSLPNQPTCITMISFNVSGSGTVAPYVPATTASIPTQSTSGNSAPAQNIPTPVTSTTGGGSISGTNGTGSGAPAISGMQNGSSTGALGASVVSAGNMKLFNFGSVCTGNNSYRLWFILLVIYILIVATVVFAEPWFLESSVLASTATILVPLILLLIFWYFSEACRAASWIPVVACVIAIVGLFLAFREYELPPLLPAPSEH